MNIDWDFVIGSTLLVVNSIVGVADFFQGGIAWPCLVVVVSGQLVALALREARRDLGEPER